MKTTIYFETYKEAKEEMERLEAKGMEYDYGKQILVDKMMYRVTTEPRIKEKKMKDIIAEEKIKAAAEAIVKHASERHPYAVEYAVRGDYNKYAVGETIPNSHYWFDNIDTGEEINGVCGTCINYNYATDYEDVLEALMEAVQFNVSAGYGSNLYVIEGVYGGYGDDEREIIIGGGAVLAKLN